MINEAECKYCNIVCNPVGRFTASLIDVQLNGCEEYCNKVFSFVQIRHKTQVMNYDCKNK